MHSKLFVAFSRQLVANVDINDARAALKAWVEHLVASQGEYDSSEILIYEDSGSLRALLKDRPVDILVLHPEEWLDLGEPFSLDPQYTASRLGQTNYKVVLLVRSDSPYTRLQDLEGTNLATEASGKAEFLCNGWRPNSHVEVWMVQERSSEVLDPRVV